MMPRQQSRLLRYLTPATLDKWVELCQNDGDRPLLRALEKASKESLLMFCCHLSDQNARLKASVNNDTETFDFERLDTLSSSDDTLREFVLLLVYLLLDQNAKLKTKVVNNSSAVELGEPPTHEIDGEHF